MGCETHIMNEYWHTKWKTKDIAWDQQQPNPLLVEYINHLKLKPGSKIFVPLSGKSIDMAWLAHQDYQVIGVELNLDACKLFFAEYEIPYQQSKVGKFDLLSSEKITLLSGDIFDLDKTNLGPVDAIYDRAALIALPIKIRQKYAQKINSLTEPHTQILLITFRYNENEMEGPPFSVNKQEIQKLYGESFHISLLYNERVLKIPEHLGAKGLSQLQEYAFHLIANG